MNLAGEKETSYSSTMDQWITGEGSMEKQLVRIGSALLVIIMAAIFAVVTATLLAGLPVLIYQLRSSSAADRCSQIQAGITRQEARTLLRRSVSARQQSEHIAPHRMWTLLYDNEICILRFDASGNQVESVQLEKSDIGVAGY